MTNLGVVIVAADGPATARSIDSVRRHLDPVLEVAIVVAPGADGRLVAWLESTCRMRHWVLVRASASSGGAAINEGVAALTAEWVIMLDAGDTLQAPALADVRDVAANADATVGILAFGVRLTGLGVDEIVHGGDARSPAGFDPVHPGLRGIVWRRSTFLDAGGLDAGLPAAARYELWLRVIGLRVGVRQTTAALVALSVDATSPLVTETSHPGLAAAAAAITLRHLGLLTAHVGDVLEARARRVSRLGTSHLAALERHRAAQQELTALCGSATPTAGDWRASPLSRDWGYERGGPLDRHYIEQFLERHADDVRGAVLEVQEADYTRRFGGEAVMRSDVVDLATANPDATIVTDLRHAANIADGTYDCVILTQTLHVIPQMGEVIAECHRILAPGGVLLLTVPAVSRVCLEYGRDGDFWRLTPAGARVLVEPVFGADVTIVAFGNAGTGAAFLAGLGREELPHHVRAVTDIYHPTIVGVRAVKARGHAAGAPALRGRRHARGLALLYHRVGASDPDPHGLSVPQDAFADQMSWLARECAVVPLDVLLDGTRRRTLPPRAVALTFDDGYEDTLAAAAPVLKALQLPATCFVMTEDLDAPHEFWWDALATALLTDGAYPPSLTVLLPEGPRVLPTATPGERLFAHGLVYHAVVGAPASMRSAVIAAIQAWAPVAARAARGRRMPARDIARLSAYGIAVGAHTVTHPQLPRLARADQVREIAASRSDLERVVGGRVDSLAFPFGAYDDTTVAAAAEAGITNAWTCEPRAVLGTDAALRLPRLDPQAPDLGRFVHRLGARFAQPA